MLTGIITILATVFAMALADAVVKLASSDMSLWQIVVVRSLLVVPVLAFLARHAIIANNFRWIVLRSLALTMMYLGIYAAIPLLDLSVIAASLYTAPLFIVALSAMFLSESISARHWVAILIGFLGVLLIVRPAASGFTPYALVPISAGLLYAVAAVITKAKCTTAPAYTLALWLNLSLLVLGSVASCLNRFAIFSSGIDYPFLFGTWSATHWPSIVVLAMLMIGISIGLAKAYQSPHPQVIASFDYAYLLFASFWGFVFFGERPDFYTLGGMVLICLAGALVLSAEFSSKCRTWVES